MQDWWKRSVIYQIYPRSFQDSNGDGVGDLQGIINRLDYLNDGTPNSLGIDAIWISPFYPSPMADFGYDVADYTDIDPLFGDLATFDKLVEEAHKRNIKIIVDYVPNHSSDEHPWFKESRSSRDNPKADWYIWKDAKPDGSRPNNWGTMFGGPAWTWDDTRQQYYFHQFDPKQPDLNWRNPDVKAAMLDVLRFWMQRGVDGFRMDVVYIVWKHPDMPDQPWIEGASGRGADDIFGQQEQIYAYNYEGVHEVMREIRGVLDEGGVLGIGELWLSLEERMLYYGTPDKPEFHLPFNFDLIKGGVNGGDTPFTAAAIRKQVDAYEAAAPEWGFPNYVLGSHDVPRLASRIGAEKARLAAMLLLSLRGVPTLYMGDEIGMVNGDIAPEQLQDPQGKLLGVEHTRDVCRTPVQWDDSAYAGFSEAEPWLPVHPGYTAQNVAAQNADPDSLLALYRALIWTRKQSDALSIGRYTPAADAPANVYAYTRDHQGERVFIALNFGDDSAEVSLPGPGTVLLHTTLTGAGEAVAGTISLAPYEGVMVTLT